MVAHSAARLRWMTEMGNINRYWIAADTGACLWVGRESGGL